MAGLKELKSKGIIAADAGVLLYNTGGGIKYTNAHKNNLDGDIPVISSVDEISL